MSKLNFGVQRELWDEITQIHVSEIYKIYVSLEKERIAWDGSEGNCPVYDRLMIILNVLLTLILWWT